jgi:sortase A
MRDKRPVDELSIEELERILAIRKREARQQQLRRMSKEGRRVVPPVSSPAPAIPVQPEPVPAEAIPQPVQPAPVQPVPQPSAAPDDGMPRFEEESPSSSHAAEKAEANATFWNMVWNRSLLVIEMLAFVGLVVIGVQMVQALQTLQQETAAVQAEAQAAAFASIPTPTITPEISLNQIVLPGGHTSPTSAGGAQFNLNEIPANLRPIVQQQLTAPIVIPTPGPESPTRIQIPNLGVDAPVVSGTSWEALKRGVGHQTNTGLPGQPGNMVLSAHNDIYGEIFRYLDQLQPGDQIIVHTTTQQYTYTVREWDIYSPRAVQVMDPTRTPTATLISCYPYQVDNQRIVVFADLQVN